MTIDRTRKAQGNRLALARKAAGWRSARAAAIENDWAESTYRAHEAGTRTIGQDDAETYAKRFRACGVNVDAKEILFGDGEVSQPGTTVVGVVGRIGAGGAIDTSSEQFDEVHPLYEITLPVSIPEDDPIAFEVTGPSMYPRYDDGDVIICSKRGVAVDSIVGDEAAVAADDGSRYLKRIVEGSRRGLYSLESHNADVIRDVRLVWASPVITVVRARRAKKPVQASRWQSTDPDPTGAHVVDRLRLLREAVGNAGLSTEEWRQVEATGLADRSVALRLCQTVPGLTLGWIYFGEMSGLPEGLLTALNPDGKDARRAS